MTWECAECGKKEDEANRIDGVCHHCGKPLCAKDRVVVTDDAFAAWDMPMPRTAVHCKECKAAYHPRLPSAGLSQPDVMGRAWR